MAKSAGKKKIRKFGTRTIIKDRGELPESAIRGRVVSIVGNQQLVEIYDNNQYIYYDCILSGTVIAPHRYATLVTTGDYVMFVPELSDGSEKLNRGVIHSIEERRNTFGRSSVKKPEREHVIAANIDNLIILMAARTPDYNKRLIDRYLISAELNGLKPVICMNKIDLDDMEFLQEDLAVYADLGIPIFYTSAKKGEGVREFGEAMKESYSVLSGPSGAGKSTLLNALLARNVQAVSHVSKSTNKGRHTTTSSRLFRFGSGSGAMIDTPGIREFGLWGLEKDELRLYFPEFKEYAEECRYNRCTHIHEPGCAVQAAVDEGLIDVERYASYLNIYETLD